MKTKSILVGLVITFSTAFSTKAQSPESAVRILPAAEKGMLKVLYAQKSESAVSVRFLGENGILKADRIKAGTFENGFSKKYDVSRIKDRIFWLEVSSADLTVRYKMVGSKEGAFTPFLESTTYNHPLVAAIN
jgi:hypothetical protein